MYTLLISGYGTVPEKTLKVYQFNEETKSITEVFGESLANPSYAVIEGALIYTMSEVEDEVPLMSYKLDNQGFMKLAQQKFEGGGIAHISYSSTHKALFGACYQTGDVLSIDVEKGQFYGVKSFISLPKGEGDISRAHCVQLDAKEEYLYVTNIHTDKIYCFKVDQGTLHSNEAFEALQLTKGIGPRDIVFHPSKSVAYITGEYSNQVTVVSQDSVTGRLEVIQQLSALAEEYTGESYCANAFVTPNGKYLFVANRGANNVAGFEIQEDGTLKVESFTCVEGNWPRLITCTPDGKYILICNQRSNEVVIKSLDQETGEIGGLVAAIPFNEPAFIKAI